MRSLIAVTLAVALSACATATMTPAKRPLTQAHIDTMGATSVVVSDNNTGVEKAWFYTSTAGAGAAYGLVGVLVSAAMDAIINAGPSARAQKAANEMAEVFTVEQLNASLVEHLSQRIPGSEPVATITETALVAETPVTDSAAAPAEAAAIAPPPAPSGVYYSDVRREQRLMARDHIEDAVVVSTRYTLSEDSSTLRIIAAATYQSAQTPYATPYEFRGSVPRTEREGPAYQNTFTYYSTQLPVPTLTPELRERLIANIQDSYRTASGALPEEGADEYRAMARELDNARDDRLTKDEIAIFLTREWLADNGALLRREIEQAHAFIAQYVAADMNRLDVPVFAGPQDELLETAADQRTVRRVGAGLAAGSYISSAGNVSSFSTYGNAIGVARVNNEHIQSLREAARDARNRR
jgi:hypothetical protein